MDRESITLGEIRDADEATMRVTALLLPADDDGKAKYEVRVRGDVQLYLDDPADRAKVEALISALGTALGHGEATGWMGSPARDVTVHPLRVDWEHRSANGARMTKVKGDR